MRYLLCLIGGALLGAILALTAASSLQRRNAWPRAIMTVMQHELAEARKSARPGQCTDAAMQEAKVHLIVLAGDLELALIEPGATDRVLGQYAQELRKAIDAWDPDIECASQSAALGAVAQACDACHRDYR